MSHAELAQAFDGLTRRAQRYLEYVTEHKGEKALACWLRYVGWTDDAPRKVRDAGGQVRYVKRNQKPVAWCIARVELLASSWLDRRRMQ